MGLRRFYVYIKEEIDKKKIPAEGTVIQLRFYPKGPNAKKIHKLVDQINDLISEDHRWVRKNMDAIIKKQGAEWIYDKWQKDYNVRGR